MLIFILVILLTLTTDFNIAITTRRSRYTWRSERPEIPRFNQEWDQYRDYAAEDHPYRSHISFNERRPSPLSVEDIYREVERYNNYNPRYHRQNRWSFDNRDHVNHNTEKISVKNSNSYQYDYEATQNTHNIGNFHDINSNRDARQTLYSPAPHLPWEDALRHSVYLTLIRDKIDNILATNHKPNIQNLDQNHHDKDLYESTDVDLWRNIKKAPFKSNGKEKGPVFGDIAILSRGKLIDGLEGFEFIEDDNFKECIECHLYSARPNEDEAEKILMTNCKEANCKNQVIRALWTVRRIRHRNPEGEDPKFMYELMFSIASPRANNKLLDYNAPSQTFTIDEGDKNIKNNLDEKRNKVAFSENKSQQIFKNSQYHFSNTNLNKQIDKHLNSGGYNDLNIGEYANVNKDKQSIASNPRIMNIHDSEEELLRNKHNNQLPVITHLHHHYYLNDKGIPMLKPSIKYDKHSNLETLVSNVHNIDTITEMDPRMFTPNLEEIIGTTASYYNEPTKTSNTNFYTSTSNPNSRSTLSKHSKSAPTYTSKKNHHPTKQFIPSPKDERITYSELDPLYTASPKSKIHSAVKNTYNPVTKVSKAVDHSDDDGYDDHEDKVVLEKSTQKPFLNYEDSITNPDTGTTIENIYISESPIHISQNKSQTKDHISERPEIVHIVYPETTTKHVNLNTEPPKQTTVNKRIERKPYKVTRRIKQKKFSDLLKAQKPSTSTLSYNSTIESPKNEESQNKNVEELQQKILDLSKKIASNKTNTFEPQRTSRYKYQRKFNYSWNSKRTRPTLITTTEKPTILEEDVSYFENNMDELTTENILETTYHDSVQDNVEGESEKEISIDRTSSVSDPDRKSTVSDPDRISTTSKLGMEEYAEKSVGRNEDTTEYSEYRVTTEPSTTDITELYKEQSEITNSYLGNEDNSTSKVQNSTETTLNSETEDVESMYTPLTKKSYVTSISLKLGNKTRPYYPSVTESPMDDTSVVEEIRLTENITSIPEHLSENVTLTSTPEEEIGNSTKEESTVVNTTEPNIAETEEGVVVAKIVEHSSLHKLKIEDI